MQPEAVDRARERLAALRGEGGEPQLAATVERAREQLESFAQTIAELEATFPERVTSTLHESLRREVLPVARHVAEVRGLSAQTIRRLERVQADLAAERRARVEDLELLVDLVASGWRAVERRLDRLERGLDRLEHAVGDRPPPRGSVLRLDERRTGPG